MSGQPGWLRHGQGAKGMAHGFEHTGEATEAARRAHDMRGVGSLPPSGPQEVAPPGDLDDGVEEQALDLTGDKAGPELAQHRGVEAWVGERQGEHVLPADPAAHGVSSLPVGQALGELKKGDQRQAPGRFRGLAKAWKQVSEALVLEDGAEFVAQAEKQRAMRKGRAGDAGGLVRDTGGDHRS